jgi:hypothetical protein
MVGLTDARVVPDGLMAGRRTFGSFGPPEHVDWPVRRAHLAATLGCTNALQEDDS